ncbi:MAG: S-adenosylmethionine:tRNA ribosyltransferase-isomerase, partial [Bdellovibrionia bacterium]
MSLVENTRCVVLENPSGRVSHRTIDQVGEFFRPGDLLVVNDAATLPASFMGTARGLSVELRLLQPIEKPRRWWAALFGRGDWRTPTENRELPPVLNPGERITIAKGFSARILAWSFPSVRMVEIEFEGFDSWHGIFLHGRPIQYSHSLEKLELWDRQTIFSGPPVALEPPSAAFCLTWSLVENWKANGIRVARLTHATGVSVTSEEKIDRLLPLPETASIPLETVAEIATALSEKRRIIAVGTGVVRALEGSDLKSPGEKLV